MLPRVSSNSYAYDPRIRFVCCQGKDKWIHLGYAIKKADKQEVFAHCHRQGVGGFNFTELADVDVGAINCKRCRDRVKVLQNPHSPMCQAVQTQRRYYHGKFASGEQKLTKVDITHLYIVPVGSDINNPELRPFCKSLVPQLKLTPVPGYSVATITCKYCRENFSKLPQRDQNGKPFGKADMWFLMGEEGFENLRPTIVSTAEKTVEVEPEPDAVELELDGSDNTEWIDDSEIFQITKYNKNE